MYEVVSDRVINSHFDFLRISENLYSNDFKENVDLKVPCIKKTRQQHFLKILSRKISLLPNKYSITCLEASLFISLLKLECL